jgi:hypothetical protein
MNRTKETAALPIMILAMTSLVMAADPDNNILKSSGALDRLLRQTGVYNASSTGKTPSFVVDPAWPQRLPNNWLLGQIGGLYVDKHDHIWVYNRPRTMTNEEAGLEGPVSGIADEKGQPINGLGQVRAYGSIADCCKAAPSVLEFDSDGKLLRAWGGPTDPGFIGGKCKAEAGCIWPSSEHGIYIDHNDNVWISGNSAAAGRGGSPWSIIVGTSRSPAQSGYWVRSGCCPARSLRQRGRPTNGDISTVLSGRWVVLKVYSASCGNCSR